MYACRKMLLPDIENVAHSEVVKSDHLDSFTKAESLIYLVPGL